MRQAEFSPPQSQVTHRLRCNLSCVRIGASAAVWIRARAWFSLRLMRAADARRRWFGLLFLTLAGGLLIWGVTLLEPHLRGWAFVVYWLACLGFTVAAMVVAWLDWHAVRDPRRRDLTDRNR